MWKVIGIRASGFLTLGAGCGRRCEKGLGMEGAQPRRNKVKGVCESQERAKAVHM